MHSPKNNRQNTSADNSLIDCLFRFLRCKDNEIFCHFDCSTRWCDVDQLSISQQQNIVGGRTALHSFFRAILCVINFATLESLCLFASMAYKQCSLWIIGCDPVIYYMHMRADGIKSHCGSYFNNNFPILQHVSVCQSIGSITVSCSIGPLRYCHLVGNFVFSRIHIICCERSELLQSKNTWASSKHRKSILSKQTGKKNSVTDCLN